MMPSNFTMLYAVAFVALTSPPATEAKKFESCARPAATGGAANGYDIVVHEQFVIVAVVKAKLIEIVCVTAPVVLMMYRPSNI